MPVDSLRVVFLGSDEFSLPILEALAVRGPSLRVPVKVVGVVTQPDRPSGRGRRLLAGPVKALGSALGVPVLQPPRVRAATAIAALSELNADLFVVASFGQILPQPVLDLPRHGCLNLHPSLLPQYRGPSPVVGPLLAGDNETGTTLMEMVLAMDAGPIVAQTRVAIHADETAGDLQQRLAQLSGDLLLEHLPEWISGQTRPQPQDDSAASYTRMVAKQDGLIEWTRSAASISRVVRAYDPWPVAHTLWEQQVVRLFHATETSGNGSPGHVLGVDGDELLIGTGDGVLRVAEMQLAGGRRLTPLQLLRGRPSLQSATFGSIA